MLESTKCENYKFQHLEICTQLLYQEEVKIISSEEWKNKFFANGSKHWTRNGGEAANQGNDISVHESGATN